jgi:hypothetical protein
MLISSPAPLQGRSPLPQTPLHVDHAVLPVGVFTVRRHHPQEVDRPVLVEITPAMMLVCFFLENKYVPSPLVVVNWEFNRTLISQARVALRT